MTRPEGTRPILAFLGMEERGWIRPRSRCRAGPGPGANPGCRSDGRPGLAGQLRERERRGGKWDAAGAGRGLGRQERITGNEAGRVGGG